MPTLAPPIGVSFQSTSAAPPEDTEHDVSESDFEDNEFRENDFGVEMMAHSPAMENRASDGSPMVLP